MKAYEFPIKVTVEGQLDVPPALVQVLPREQVVRAIFLVDERVESDEQAAWAHLTAGQFLAGYGESDAIYDQLS